MIIEEQITRVAATVSFAVIWASMPFAVADVTEKEISISVTLYVSSIIATAAFTWAIAKHDSKRARDVELLAERLDRALRELAKTGHTPPETPRPKVSFMRSDG